MDKMSWKEIKEIAEEYSHMNVGKIRVNHNSVDCVGGSNSMLVEKKDDGNISVCCFRCNRSGYYGTASTLKSLKARIEPEKDIQVTDSKYRLPGDCTGDIRCFPPAARVFINKAGLTKEEVENYEISYSESIGRVVIPVGISRSGTDVQVASFQTRKVHDGDKLPKYLSYKNRNHVFIAGEGSGKSIVFTEDVLSAIKVGRIMPAIALLGVKLQDYHLRYIAKHGYNDFIIFLDDDNAQVQLNQLKAFKQLSVFGSVRVIHSQGIDPKEMSDADLKRIIHDT